MPYGTITKFTREYLTKRAAESNIALDKLGLDYEFPEEESELEKLDNWYEISVIFEGALDEEFYVVTDYEVNIADWVAETCRDEHEKSQDKLGWSVTVFRADTGDDDDPTVIYRVTDETIS